MFSYKSRVYFKKHNLKKKLRLLGYIVLFSVILIITILGGLY